MREFGEPLPGITYVPRPGAYGFLYNPSGELAIVETPAGLFLPGGGVESGEALATALAREIFEEIGYRLIAAELKTEASQYHWSEFYQKHFLKIGSFFRIEAVPPPKPHFQADHSLTWLSVADAGHHLTQEFQRWAVQTSA